jgi:hypothetical protein
MINPGYLKRMEKKLKTEKQQEYLLEKFRKNVNSDSHSTVSRFSEGKPFLTNFEKEILTKQVSEI